MILICYFITTQSESKLKQGLMGEEESRAWVRGANSDTSLRTYGKDRSIDGPGGGGGFLEGRGGGIRLVPHES